MRSQRREIANKTTRPAASKDLVRLLIARIERPVAIRTGQVVLSGILKITLAAHRMELVSTGLPSHPNLDITAESTAEVRGKLHLPLAQARGNEL